MKNHRNPKLTNHANLGRRKFHVSKDWLERVSKTYSFRQIELLFGIPRNTVSLYMKDYGIPTTRTNMIQTSEQSREVRSFRKFGRAS